MVGDSLLAALLGFVDLLIYVSSLPPEVAASDEPSPDVGLPGTLPWFLVFTVDVAMVAPLAFRRKYPLTVAYTVLVVSIPHSALQLGFSSALAGMIALYSAVVYAGRRQGALYVLILVIVSGLQLVLQREPDIVVVSLFLAFALALCWVLGEFVGARRAYQSEVEARLHLLETERDQAARIAVGEERSRIARELHDVVAHAVSVMVVQADGASYAITSNPAMAARALNTISETGRGALAELRRLLDVLRNEDGDGEPRVPQPNAEALVELAERCRSSGLAVDLDINEDLGDLPAGVSLGVYRIVQESLTNALKHAGRGAKASVRVHRNGDVMEIEVTDDGAGRANSLVKASAAADVPGGNGLIGMRERAHVFGGSLDVGPAAGGGWRVSAKLPIKPTHLPPPPSPEPLRGAGRKAQ
jgi:signal transduction histidine kinase